MTLDEILQLENKRLFEIPADEIAAAVIVDVIGPADPGEDRSEVEKFVTPTISTYAAMAMITALINRIPEEEKEAYYTQAAQTYRLLLRLTQRGARAAMAAGLK